MIKFILLKLKMLNFIFALALEINTQKKAVI